MSASVNSPFVDRVFNLLPQGHEEAMKHAFYNVAALTFIFASGATATAVFFILQPFVKPLLWAMLIGSVLHPVKHKLVIRTRKWLDGLGDDKSMLAFEFLSLPVKIVDVSAEWIGSAILARLKLLLCLVLGIPTAYFIQQMILSKLLLLYNFYDICCYIFNILVSFSAVPLPVAVGICTGSLTLVATLAGRFSPIALKLISHFTWIFIYFVIADLFGSFKFLVFLATLVLLLVSYAIQFHWINGEPDGVFEETVLEEENEEFALDVGSTPSRSSEIRKHKSFRTPFAISQMWRESFVGAAIAASLTPAQPTGAAPETGGQTSNGYIQATLWACLAVQLWRHMWLLHFFPIPLVCFIIKLIGSYVGLWRFLNSQRKALIESVSDWLAKYQDQIFPRPLQRICQAVVYFDRLSIDWLRWQVDLVVTVIMIIIVIVLALLVSIIVAVQIYGESVQLVQLGTGLVNRTLTDPEAQQWLPHGIDEVVASLVDNAYNYGKTSVATFVKNVINENSVDSTRAAQLERTIMEALDRIQQLWHNPSVFRQSAAASIVAATAPIIGSHTSAGIEQTLTEKPPLLLRISQDFLNWTVLMNFGRENVGMILSILDSIWTVLKGNLSLVFKSTTSILSILMGGSTAILNFLVNGVVFLTALYYLLASSGSKYRPVQLVSLLSPGAGSTLGTAMEEAINTVCMASLKLAAFYGLWTWLIHTMFQVNFTFIPAAVAALFGAVPFLGTYWAALPAALDLWLAQSRGFEAILLFVFQLAPTMIVDASFYAEIKGGGHPYLTGLAVAGGIFWLGFEGAIIGPLLLCVLLVAVTVYTSTIQDNHVAEVNNRWIHRRLMRIDTIG